MNYRNDDPDVEIPGFMVDNGSAKAFHFQGDFWDEPEWVPRSQAEWVPDPDRTDGGGILFVKAWLAKKNGWGK